MTRAVVACLLFAWSWAAAAAPPAVEAFARLPQMSDATISPDGRYVAAKVFSDDQYFVVIFDLDNVGKQKPLVATPRGQEVQWLSWKNPGRLLVSLAYPSRRYGVATVETRLIAMNPDGKNVKYMVLPKRGEDPVQIADDVVDFLPQDPDHILMAFNPEDPRLPRLYRINVNSAGRSVIDPAGNGINSWVVDQQGRPRIGFGIDAQKMLARRYHRGPNDSKWTLAHEAPIDAGPEFSPLLFDADDPDILYVLSNHEADTTGIYRYRMSTQAFVDRLFIHPDVDAAGVVYDSRRTRIEGIGYVTDEAVIEWLPEADDSLPVKARALADVRLRVRARELSVESTSWDYRRMIIYAESPDVPGRYYLYEPGTESLRLLGVTYPELDEQPLSPMRPVRYKARDGLEIPGYLSLPPGSGLRPATPLPAVVMPHGGPYVRDFAAFDPLVQLLTSRGYAVLQMNYRGSTGYGAEFQAAGQRQWGKAMQDDVTDGTAWLVAEGIADPARICIVGWSYGGYAALMGAAKEPDRYRCSVSIAGVADLRRLVESSNKYLYGRVSTRFIGDAWRDRKDLTENSPARRASAIRVPVLLAHGTKDRVVDPDQSRMMAAALKSAGRSFEYIELKDADHSVTQMPQRQQLFDAVDRFLGQYLGGS